MDLAQMLVRSCMRSFYDTKHILVFDALVIHSALRDDDLAYLMSINTKELHKLCGKLKEDRFLAVHSRPEIKEGQQRPINRTYYFIDYRATIDAIKWRVYQIDKAVQGNTVPDDERKEYFCPRCKSEWTTFEVLDKRSYEGFLCHKCDYLLVHDPDNNRGGHEQSSKLNAQFKFITDLLPKIDKVVIPANTFEQALSTARKVVRDEANPGITLTNGEGPTAADIAAEQARKEKTAAQNALPQHFTHSTITGEQVKFGSQPTTSVGPAVDANKKYIKPETEGIGEGAEIDDYFAQLKAAQAKELEQEADEEYETDDEEEEGFEDVIPNGTTSGAATPASSVGGTETKPSVTSGSGLSGVLKHSRNESVSASGTSTGRGSPVTGPNTPNEDRPTKRVRIEEPAPTAPAIKDEEESEEDMEFEDV
ncbi:hypothetical protein BPOR_0698g00050 [Botrytis porri]|uniref:HTH TFE/IIEalpha-type domain-containing protein n=1 Tax=Botrytis porri TaxID=87229 RepID=A0A4Z1KG17_9HELO|nr:hypothetical protein BPOR_0698g00050 [Botrytis porri]